MSNTSKILKEKINKLKAVNP
jgi:hypothetical protein